MLELVNISFAFGRRWLFQNLNVHFARKERVALLAPSGFGKTTLCRLLAGYEQPCSGEIRLDGQPLYKTHQRTVCPVQMIGQNPTAVIDARMRLGDSLAESSLALKHWRSAKGLSDFEGVFSDLDGVQLLRSLGIEFSWFYRFPHELSGGQLQRFCIARALLAKPSYLLADEITTMLDGVATAQIWSVLLDYLSLWNTGLIFVSHDPALVSRIATRRLDLTGLVQSGNDFEAKMTKAVHI